MANNELLAALQSDLTAVKAIQATITNDIAEMKSRLTHADVVLQQLIKQGDDCPICHEKLVDPTESPCNHVFCHQCITNWLSGPGTTCPSCRRHLAPGNLRPVEQRPDIIQPASVEPPAHNPDYGRLAKGTGVCAILSSGSIWCSAERKQLRRSGRTTDCAKGIHGTY